MGNPRNSKSQIELSLERELDVLVKVSISLKSEFDPENQFSVILGKVSISLKSELNSQRSHVPKWYIFGVSGKRSEPNLTDIWASRAKEITILLYYCITVW